MKIKQMFCDHIWKKDSEELLNSKLFTNIGWVYFAQGCDKRFAKRESLYAIYYRCIKCDKEKIEEEIRQGLP